MKQLKCITLMTLLASSMLIAQDRPGAVFLLITPGARAVAMGSAFTASTDDPSALYYNPGVLAFYNRCDVLVMNQGLPPGIGRFVQERFLDITEAIISETLAAEPMWLPGLHPNMHYIYGAMTIPVPHIGTWAVQYTYLTTGINEVWIPEYSGEYESYDCAVGISYGRALLRRFGIGITAKYIYSYLVPEWVWTRMPELGIDNGGTGSSFAIDGGILYRLPGFGIGLSLQNLGPRMSYELGTSDRLPTRMRWGVTIEPLVMVDSLMIAAGTKQPSISSYFSFGFSNDVSYDIEDFEDSWTGRGIELTLLRLFSYRRGSFKDEEYGRRGKTWGFGFKLRNIDFDIATDRSIYDFFTENWRVQVQIHPVNPPQEFTVNKKLNTMLTLASASLAPGGGQFYKGEGIKGALFFVPSLFLGHAYYRTDSQNTKTWSLVGLGALYVTAALESLLHQPR